MVSQEIDNVYLLNILANVLQIANYVMSVEDVKNTDILNELQKQNSEYLEKIIEQNEAIIEQNKVILHQLTL